MTTIFMFFLSLGFIYFFNLLNFYLVTRFLIWRGIKDNNAIKCLALLNMSYSDAIYIMSSHMKYRSSVHYNITPPAICQLT